MSNMRYRKPSVKTVLGVTKWKKRVKKALGINKLLWPFRAVNNYQRRMLRRAGYYSPEMKMMRAAKRGQAPGPIGPIQLGERGDDDGSGEQGADNSALLMAAMLAKGEHDHKDQDDNSLLMAAMLAKGMQGSDAGKGHKKGGKAGPNLAEAMLLASALQDSEEAHAPKAKHAAEPHAPKAKQADERAAHHADQPHAGRAKAKPAAASDEHEPPKRRRGLRLFGLFVVALLETAAIVAVWYYWIA
jgi:hypothetical protein